MPRPKKIASNHARELAKYEFLLDAFESSVGIPALWLRQKSNASTARTVQIARPIRQLPVRAITSGAKEAPMAAPPMIDVT
ncbi:hypothetical protein D3C81_1658850 [compost metagenome]